MRAPRRKQSRPVPLEPAAGAHQEAVVATSAMTIAPTTEMYEMAAVTPTRPATTPHDTPSRLACCAAMSKLSHVSPPTAAAICSHAQHQ